MAHSVSHIESNQLAVGLFSSLHITRAHEVHIAALSIHYGAEVAGLALFNRKRIIVPTDLPGPAMPVPEIGWASSHSGVASPCSASICRVLRAPSRRPVARRRSRAWCRVPALGPPATWRPRTPTRACGGRRALPASPATARTMVGHADYICWLRPAALTVELHHARLLRPLSPLFVSMSQSTPRPATTAKAARKMPPTRARSSRSRRPPPAP